jgi:cysteine-rich repeat protein
VASGGVCGNGNFDPGEDCDDGNTSDGDCCSSTCTFEPAGSACPDDGNPCTDNKCNGLGVCLRINITGPCDDGSFCTVGDSCQAGVCQGAPRDCSAAGDQCSDGVCDEVAAECVGQTKPDGTGCDDSDLCTQSDVCLAGNCTGQNAVVCTPIDQCHDAGVCDPGTGVCSSPVKADGMACDDGDLCTQTDVCLTGMCMGGDPIVCTALDECHDVGVCDPASGA